MYTLCNNLSIIAPVDRRCVLGEEIHCILNFFPLPVTGSLRWTMIHNQHQDHYPASRGLFLESTLFLDPPDWSRKIEETSGRRVYTQEYFFVFYHHTQKKHWKPSMRFIPNNIATGSIQGSRQTFQLASPVASDRFDSLAKTIFSLPRYSNIHHCIKSSK